MMNAGQTNLAVRTAVGALGGAAGALLRARGLHASRRLPSRLQPTLPRRDPDAFLVSKLEGALHRPLPWKLHGALARGLLIGHGAANGALLALLTRQRGLRTAGGTLLAGAGLGAAQWAIGYAGWMPRARLVPPLRGQGMNHVLVSVLGFAAAGLLTAAPVLLLDRVARPKPWWKRALASLGV